MFNCGSLPLDKTSAESTWIWDSCCLLLSELAKWGWLSCLWHFSWSMNFNERVACFCLPAVTSYKPQDCAWQGSRIVPQIHGSTGWASQRQLTGECLRRAQPPTGTPYQYPSRVPPQVTSQRPLSTVKLAADLRISPFHCWKHTPLPSSCFEWWKMIKKMI